MNQLTEAYVDSLALNSGAIKNGRDLVKKNSFPVLCKSEDGTLLFGECKGSGSKPYVCSVDFIKEGSPVFRCSCPSRQFPCKHLLGLMYAYTSGKPFKAADIPQDILDKREKAGKREEKKKEPASRESAAPRKKTNHNALVKKIASQLEGIAILEKLIIQLMNSGLGSVDKKMLQTLEDQAKELGNYYIPGIQSALRELVLLFRSDESMESVYSKAFELLTTLYALVKKSREYLEKRAASPELQPDTETTMEEWLGHAWQLAELREQGKLLENRELLQISFRSYADHARGEYVDEGFWADTESGRIYAARTYRPFRAAKYIKEEDSFYEVMRVKELYLYPGEMNARVRWEESVSRPAAAQDYLAVRSHALQSATDAVKLVKNQIKNPLSDKHPVLLLAYSELKRDSEGALVLLDPGGKALRLGDLPEIGHPTVYLLPMLHRDCLKNQTMLLMFGHDMDSRRLTAQPLSIVTEDAVIRLLY